MPNYPKIWGLTTASITVSMGQASGDNLTGFSVSGSLMSCNQGVIWGAAVISRLNLGKGPPLSSFTWLLIQFRFLQAFGEKLP